MPNLSTILVVAVGLGACFASPASAPARGNLRRLQGSVLVKYQGEGDHGLAIRRSAWAPASTPPDRCAQILLYARESCCWMETEHRTYQEVVGADKVHTRWACTEYDSEAGSCTDLAHRFSFPADPEKVHTCLMDVHQYNYYRLEMAITEQSTEGDEFTLTPQELPQVDAAVERAIVTLLNVSHRSLVISEKAQLETITWPHGTFDDGCVLEMHFQRDEILEAQRDEASEEGNFDIVARHSVLIANIANALNSPNVLEHQNERLGSLILDNLQKSPGEVRAAKNIWLNITVESKKSVETAMVDGAREATSSGVWALALSLLVALGAANVNAL